MPMATSRPPPVKVHAQPPAGSEALAVCAYTTDVIVEPVDLEMIGVHPLGAAMPDNPTPLTATCASSTSWDCILGGRDIVRHVPVVWSASWHDAPPAAPFETDRRATVDSSPEAGARETLWVI